MFDIRSENYQEIETRQEFSSIMQRLNIAFTLVMKIKDHCIYYIYANKLVAYIDQRNSEDKFYILKEDLING